jgi:predicted alpha/beta-hydrolase family hydrolase
MRLEIAGGRVDLDRPKNPTALLLLTHGAGGGVETRDLLAVRTAALEAGIAVGLVTQPFRVAGRRTPPQPGPQDEAWRTLVTTLRRRRGLAGLPLLVGGRSNGARVACRTAEALGAVGVVALAFPVHPPGKPESSRLVELDAVRVPVLVVQGDRDPFGMPPRRRGRTLLVVEGGDHNLRTHLDATAKAVVSFVTSTVGRATVPG